MTMTTRDIVIQEFQEYVMKTEKNRKFDLNDASATYKAIAMADGIKPRTEKATLARSILKEIRSGEGVFSHVTRARICKNGQWIPEESPNKASMFIVI